MTNLPNDNALPEREFRMVLPYSATPRGIVWHKIVKKEPVEVLLSNFDARIVREILHDDASTERLVFEIQVHVQGRKLTIQVPAARFSSMTWTVEQLGADAVISAGAVLRDHLRMAIQKLSGDIPKHRVYQHTGWRLTTEHGWVYLHHNGGISSKGLISDIAVGLEGPLANVAFTAPPIGDSLVEAIRACMRFDCLVPDRIAVPIRAMIARAVLGPSDFSVFLSGPSGTGKTEYAALAQQHFGAGFDAGALPASWSSTENALEDLAFIAKDALLTIDDFAPTGSTYHVQQLHAKAERIFRAAGNRSARQRMRADLSQVPPRPPRGIILATGEDVPRGYSLNARLLHLPVGPEDMIWKALSKCQSDAAAGLYAQAMAGFLRWLAPQYERIQSTLKTDVSTLRSEVTGSHRRSPTIAANLGVALRYWMQYVVDSGVMTEADGAAYWDSSWEVLKIIATRQDEHQVIQEPTRQFLELLRMALAGGHAHIEAVEGGPPQNHPKWWGWKLRNRPQSEAEYVSQGSTIGWVEGNNLYLEPSLAFQIVKRLGRDIESPITINDSTLKRRLNEKGLLVRTELESRGTYTVRKTVVGNRPDVLHLSVSSLFKESDDAASTLLVTPTNPTTDIQESDPLVGDAGSDDNNEPAGNDGTHDPEAKPREPS